MLRALRFDLSLLVLIASIATTSSAAPVSADAALLARNTPLLAGSGADGRWIPLPVQPIAPPPTGPPPTDLSAREGHSIVFDSLHQQFLAFGGLGAFGRMNDIWAHAINGFSNWAPISVPGPGPSPRYDHSAVYDSAGSRMLVFGGDAGALQNDVWQLDLSGATPAWSLVPTTGTPPSPRAAHSAVFDPVRRRMVVFGGRTPAFTNETWILDFTTTPATWQLATVGGSVPPVASGHVAILDPVGDRMVIDGAFIGGAWGLSMSTLTWSPIPTTNGPGLFNDGVRAAYEPVGNRMFVSSGDLWSLDLASGTWTHLILFPHPDTRAYAGFTLDPSGHHGILHGGFIDSYVGDTWLLTVVGSPAWSNVQPIVSLPPPVPIAHRHSAAGIYDPLRDRFLMLGGYQGSSVPNTFGDLAGLQVGTDSAWVDLLDSTPIGPLAAEGAVYDPVRDRVVVFGGNNGSFLNDVWLIALTPTLSVSHVSFGLLAPEPRDHFVSAYDPVRDRIVVYGGDDQAMPLGDVWALNLSPSLSWIPLTPQSGPEPLPRMMHSGVYDPNGDRLIVFGGLAFGDPCNEVWALSLGGTPTWTQLSPAGAGPSPRYSCSLQLDPNRQRAILFGGATFPTSPPNIYNEVWALSLTGSTPVWTQLAPAGTPPGPRYLHYAVDDPVHDRMLVSGGSSGLGTLEDVWLLQFSPDGATATDIALISSDARSDGVTLKWALAGDAATYARLERRDATSDWRTIESGAVSGSSVTFEDREIVAGGRYAYRLTAIAGSKASTSSEVWIDVPAGPSFSLAGFSPNPAPREARVSFSLAERTPATIEIVDVGGRRVASQRIDSPTLGAQTIAISPEGALAPGLYFVRLTQGTRTLTARGTIVR